MLSNLLIGTALITGGLKGLKEGLHKPPAVPPEGIGIWWCKECNRWQAWQNDNPKPLCYYHKKPVPMSAHFYTYGGPLNATTRSDIR